MGPAVMGGPNRLRHQTWMFNMYVWLLVIGPKIAVITPNLRCSRIFKSKSLATNFGPSKSWNQRILELQEIIGNMKPERQRTQVMCKFGTAQWSEHWSLVIWIVEAENLGNVPYWKTGLYGPQGTNVPANRIRGNLRNGTELWPLGNGNPWNTDSKQRMDVQYWKYANVAAQDHCKDPCMKPAQIFRKKILMFLSTQCDGCCVFSKTDKWFNDLKGRVYPLALCN